MSDTGPCSVYTGLFICNTEVKTMKLVPEKMVRIIEKIEKILLVVLGVSATLLMFVNALSRYLLSITIVWAEEVIRVLFVWAMFIAITSSFIRGEHIGFDGLAKKNKVFHFISDFSYGIFLMLTGFLLAFFGYKYAAITGSVPLPATNLPTSIFMWPGIIAGAVWFGFGLYKSIHEIIHSGRPMK